MSKELDKKIERSIKILRMPQDSEIELCYSGGKDSDVILELAKMAGIKYRAIYKNTTIDPPGTIQHCKEAGCEIIRPKVGFFDLIKKKGYPNRYCRFCCQVLKEYKILDTSIQGIRRSESTKRAKRYSSDDPIVCRSFGSKKEHVNIVLPILDWTNDDVAEFVDMRGIKCHPLYYDENGKFDVTRRLGCMGCPLAAKNGLREFERYPHLVKAWVRAGQVYLDTHPNVRSNKLFENSCDMFMKNVFFNSYTEFHDFKYGLFGKEDTKKFLEDYFNIKL